MVQRTQALVARVVPNTGRVLGGTFHSVAHRLVRTHASSLGLAPGFGVLDAGDACRPARPGAPGAGARREPPALPARADDARHLLAHGQRPDSARGGVGGGVSLVRGAPRGAGGAVPRLRRAQARARGARPRRPAALLARARGRRGDRTAHGRRLRPRAGRRVPGRQRPAGRHRARAAPRARRA